MSKADNLCRERNLFELHDYAKELEKKLDYYESRIGSHYRDCYKHGRAHYECATRKIAELEGIISGSSLTQYLSELAALNNKNKELESQNTSLRAAQKSCEDCDTAYFEKCEAQLIHQRAKIEELEATLENYKTAKDTE